MDGGNQNSLRDPEAAEAENQDSEAEDTPRKLSKHVSFSEDLTLFEAGSTETSSNFEDERGDDGGKEEEFMSLDDAPDPK